MRRVKFSTLGEEVRFDDNGDPIASYDLMNWHKGPDGSLRLVKVGFYNALLVDEQELVINDSAIQWPVGQQVCGGSRRGLKLRLLIRLVLVVLLTLVTLQVNVPAAVYKLQDTLRLLLKLTH